MYVPAQFRPAGSDDVKEFIGKGRFGILVSVNEGRPVATHIPFEADYDASGKIILEGHLSAANPQAKDLNGPVMVIFQGPDAYISSSWYNHPNVPTWNYIAVHIYGNATELTGDELRMMMTRQLKKHEGNSSNPVTMESLPQKYLEDHLKGIRCFRFESDRIEAAIKMSQNRNDSDHASIIDHLNTGDEVEKKVAEIMKKMRG